MSGLAPGLLARMALRNALRNQRRTALTALTVTLGTALLTVGLSWFTGIANSAISASTEMTGHVRVATPRFVEREHLMPLAENIAQTDPLVERLARVPGVVAVWPRIMMGVAATRADQELGENFGLMQAMDLAWIERQGLRQRISSGAWFTSDGKGEALVGRQLAKDMGLSAGEEAIFIGQTQDGSLAPMKARVVGIVDTGMGVLDRMVWVPLEQGRWMADIPGGALEIVLFAEDRDDAPALAAAAQSALPPELPLVVQAWSSREPMASIMAMNYGILRLVSAVIIFIAGLGVLNTMLMSVLERTAEVGVLKALGMRTSSVIALFTLEALFIATSGGVLGAVLGSLGGLYLEDHGYDLGEGASDLAGSMPIHRVLHADWSPEIALIALGCGMAMALVGSLLPAWRAARIQPVVAMSSRT
jgi:putative ABC transport system permease protein